MCADDLPKICDQNVHLCVLTVSSLFIVVVVCCCCCVAVVVVDVFIFLVGGCLCFTLFYFLKI